MVTQLQMVSDTLALKMYFTAAYALLVYDYFLTLPAEIQFAWKSWKTLASALFFLNRYITLVFSTVIMTSYYLTSWTTSSWVFTFLVLLPLYILWYCSRCDRFAIWEFIYTVITFTIAEIFLALRVYVLARKNIYVALISILHLLAQLGLAFYIISRGAGDKNGRTILLDINTTGLLDQNALQVCVLMPKSLNMKYDDAYLALALSFDAFVFIATLITTFAATRQFRAKPWQRVIQRDGIIYFMAIFTSTLVWLLLNETARITLKFMNNIPDLIFTSVMINRLYLSLKEAGSREEELPHLYLRKNRRPRTDMELQVIVSQEVTSVLH